MANYKVNTKNKTIIIDIDKVTDNEMRLIQTYVAVGYILKEKKKGVTYEDMRKELKKKNNEAALEELNKMIKNKENYMTIKKWYKEKIK